MSNDFRICDKSIGDSHPCYLIAEIAQAHDGSLGMAHAFIDAAAAAGADAVKFQTHIADIESTKNEKFRINFSYVDATRFDYWKRMEFTLDQWMGLKAHAEERKLAFLSSPFSVAAYELLSALDLPAWKIASGELRNIHLLESMLSSSKPLLISTGMSSWREIDDLVQIVEKSGNDFCLMQCTSLYPTPIEGVGLNILDEFKSRYNCQVGLSDHSGLEYPPIMAIARGASVLEMHLTMSPYMFGPDVESSLTVEQFKLVADARDCFFKLKNSPVNKDYMANNLAQNKTLFGRSLALVRNLPKGTILTKEMIALKKPGTGIQFEDIEKVEGKRLNRDVKFDELLTWDFFDE